MIHAHRMISVLLPVRNGSRTLNAALESMSAQTLTPTECVVVDDGSTDSTPAVLEQWKARWSALRTLRTPGVGIGAALNLALEQARSPWLARMDADDRSHAERLERQLAAANDDPTLALIGCKVSHWIASGEDAETFAGMRRHVEWANAQATHEELEMALWIDSPLPHPTWLAHRRAFSAAGTYDTSEDVPEDYEWLHRFFAAARDHSNNKLRAAKIGGQALVDWADSTHRLTRSHRAYLASAFDKVKADALTRRFGSEQREVYVFGLGPKGKALFPLLSSAFRVKAIVDANPRHDGIKYQGVDVWSIDRWTRERRSNRTLVVNCVGTPEARRRCESLCEASGLIPGETFVSL